MGSIWRSFHFIVLGKGVWTFHFRSGIPPFWNLENVLSPQGTLRSRTQWGPFDIFPFYCGLGKGFWTFRFRGGNHPFWNLENVLSPEGTLRKQNPMGSIWQSFHFIVIEKRFLDLSFQTGYSAFLKGKLQIYAHFSVQLSKYVKWCKSMSAMSNICPKIRNYANLFNMI